MTIIVDQSFNIITDGNKPPTTIVTGIMGPQGPLGPTGPQGAGLAITAAVNTIADLPTQGSPGDSIFVAGTGKVYVWSAT